MITWILPTSFFQKPMDSLEVYTILFEQYVKNGSSIDSKITQVAYKLLNQLILRNQSIQPNWGPFQVLVDDFFCSVADIKNTPETFKQVFKYFFMQQRFDKAAGSYFRLAQKQIQELNVLQELNDIQTTVQIIELLKQVTKNLAIALTITKLNPQKVAVWGYSVQGANECIINQLQEQEQKLIEENIVDEYQIQLKQQQLNQIQQRIQEQRLNNANSYSQTYTVDYLEQLFVLYESKIQLIGASRFESGVHVFSKHNNTYSKPDGVSQQLTTLYINNATQVLKLTPFEVYNALINQGNIDQALTIMQKFSFSPALLVQRVVKQIILLMNQMTSEQQIADIQGTYKIQYNQNKKIGDENFQRLFNLNNKYFNTQAASKNQKELEELLHVLNDCSLASQENMTGQTSYIQFCNDFIGEIVASAMVAAHQLCSSGVAPSLFNDFIQMLKFSALGDDKRNECYKKVIQTYDIQWGYQVLGLQAPQPVPQVAIQPTQIAKNQVAAQNFNVKNYQPKQPPQSKYAQRNLNNYLKKDEDMKIDDLKDRAYFNPSLKPSNDLNQQQVRQGGIQQQITNQQFGAQQQFMQQPQQQQNVPTLQQLDNTIAQAEQLLNGYMGITNEQPKSILRKSQDKSMKNVTFKQ